MLSRVLEPEVMDTTEDAVDYNAMDHTHVNRVFVDDLLRVWPKSEQTPRVFDAGTGTAQIPIELLGRGIAAKVVAADAAIEMLRIARKNITAAGLDDAITCVECDCKWLPDPDAAFDIVMSNSIIHHIPEPFMVFGECWRILKPGGLLFVRDLHRPQSESERSSLVDQYAAGANDHQRRLFSDSLRAALTVDEVRDLVQPLGIPASSITMTSDRHWTLSTLKPRLG